MSEFISQYSPDPSEVNEEAEKEPQLTQEQITAIEDWLFAIRMVKEAIKSSNPREAVLYTTDLLVAANENLDKLGVTREMLSEYMTRDKLRKE